jgi:glycosyltransferase involved in cell wall biosynthesis
VRIAIVSPEFPPEFGGMQTYAAEFALELARRGHEVHVFTRRREVSQATLPGLTVHGVLYGLAGPDREVLRGHRADAWHVMNAAYAWVALEFSPVVVTVHGNDFLRPYISVGEPDLAALPGGWRLSWALQPLAAALGRWRTPRLMRAGLGRATRILTNSRYTETVFLQRFPECRGRTQAAMVGVGAAYLAEPPAPRSAVPQLVTVCRLSERRKNVDLVLRALGRLKDAHDFHYTVVGDGEQRSELEALAAADGLQGRVTFTGFLAAPELRRCLASSDLFVLTAAINPASHEGFGIVYLEANACGTPTLAARLAGAAEAVDEGRSGFFVRDLTVEALVEAIGSFLRGERRFDPQACRDFAAGFGWDRVVDAAMPWYRAGGAA